MDEVFELIEKHRNNGILLDTNLMVLLLVGLVNPERIVGFKRTSHYSKHDFERLVGVVDQFERRYITPGIWAEVNNLTDLKGDELQLVRAHFKQQAELVIEHHSPARDLVAHAAFSRLGFTDASICELAKQPILVLTDDLDLHMWLQEHDVDSVKFTWLRRLE